MQEIPHPSAAYFKTPHGSTLTDIGSRVLSIHQPNYLPWPGYFFKIYASDFFVFLDDVEYTKKSLTKRSLIRQAKHIRKKSYLTVPLRRHSDTALIHELLIDHNQHWPRHHLNKLRNTYAGAPFFSDFFPELERWLLQAHRFKKLADLNIFLIKKILMVLEIDTPLALASDLPITGGKSGYNLNLVSAFGGQLYLSGTGARKYQDEGLFQDAGIQLAYSDWLAWSGAHPYHQSEGPWLNGLSILDALFNVGPTAILDYFRTYRESLFNSER